MFVRCIYKHQLGKFGKISMLAAMAEQLDNPDVNSAVIAMISLAGDQEWSWPARNAYKPIKGQLAKPGKP